MKRRRKRRREKSAKAGGEAAAEADAADDEVLTAADELELLQVGSVADDIRIFNSVCLPPQCGPYPNHFLAPLAALFQPKFQRVSVADHLTCHASMSICTSMQVIRSKHKIRSFVFSTSPRRGLLVQLTLSLANNAIEVRPFLIHCIVPVHVHMCRLVVEGIAAAAPVRVLAQLHALLTPVHESLHDYVAPRETQHHKACGMCLSEPDVTSCCLLSRCGMLPRRRRPPARWRWRPRATAPMCAQ